MKIIALTKSRFSIVDDSDYEALVANKWCASECGKNFYAVSRINGKVVHMHRFLESPPPGMLVDHINGNTLDNRRENLRVCTKQQNCANQAAKITNTSGFKGVYWNPSINKWCSQIMVKYKKIHLGVFVKAEDAADAYDLAAKKHFGEFANTNKAAE